MSNRQEREDRAFDTLFADAALRAIGEMKFEELTGDHATIDDAMQLVPDDFIDRLVAGKIERPDATIPTNPSIDASEGQELGCVLYRTEGLDDQMAEKLNRIDEAARNQACQGGGDARNDA